VGDGFFRELRYMDALSGAAFVLLLGGPAVALLSPAASRLPLERLAAPVLSAEPALGVPCGALVSMFSAPVLLADGSAGPVYLLGTIAAGSGRGAAAGPAAACSVRAEGKGDGGAAGMGSWESSPAGCGCAMGTGARK
jgi:hypothetical protein